MVNLLRAQGYRLAREPLVWGFAAVMAAMATLASASVTSEWLAGASWPGLPALDEGQRAAGVGCTSAVETILGITWMPLWTAVLASLAAAALFGDDVGQALLRPLAAGRRFRVAYPLAAALLTAAMALLLMAVAALAAAVVAGLTPGLAVSGDGLGRTARWMLETALITVVYGMLALAAAVAAGSRAAGVATALLLSLGVPERLAVAALEALGRSQEAVALGQALPAGQLLGPLAEGVTPTAADLAPWALLALAATGLCALALRRRDL